MNSQVPPSSLKAFHIFQLIMDLIGFFFPPQSLNTYDSFLFSFSLKCETYVQLQDIFCIVISQSVFQHSVSHNLYKKGDQKQNYLKYLMFLLLLCSGLFFFSTGKEL